MNIRLREIGTLMAELKSSLGALSGVTKGSSVTLYGCFTLSVEYPELKLTVVVNDHGLQSRNSILDSDSVHYVEEQGA